MGAEDWTEGLEGKRNNGGREGGQDTESSILTKYDFPPKLSFCILCCSRATFINSLYN